MRRLLFILLLVPAIYAQESEQTFEIRDFKGLNTKASLFDVQANESRVAHNIDFSRNLGSLTPRLGYDSVSGITGVDSIVDLWATHYDDGTAQMFLVTAVSDSGYGKLYAITPDSVNIGNGDNRTIIAPFWSIINKSTFAQYDNWVYIVNGSHRGVVYNKKANVAREFPMRRPGEPLIIPLNIAGDLDGEYVYSFYQNSYDTTVGANNAGGAWAYYNGILSNPVKVNDGQVLMTRFPFLEGDTMSMNTRQNNVFSVLNTVNNYTYTINFDTGNSVSFDVSYVSDGTATQVEIITNLITNINADTDVNDSILAQAVGNNDLQALLSHKRVLHGSYIITLDDSLQWLMAGSSADKIDSGRYHNIIALRSVVNPGDIETDPATYVLTDGVFLTGNEVNFSIIDSGQDGSSNFFTVTKQGRDSAGAYTKRFASPGYKNAGQVAAGSRGKWGVYQGYNRIDTNGYEIRGVYYAYTLYDTLNGFESDTSRSLFVRSDSIGAQTPDSNLTYVITLPQAFWPHIKKTKINLYRGTIWEIGRDSLWTFAEFLDSVYTVCKWVPAPKASTERERDILVKVCREVTITDTVRKIGSMRVYGGQYIYSPLRHIATLSHNIRSYTDSISVQSMQDTEQHPDFFTNTGGQLSLMDNIFSFQDRLWTADGNKLYYSDANNPFFGSSVNDWSDLNYIPINENDGDVITYAYPDNGVIRIFKNRSSYIVRPLDNEAITTVIGDDVFLPHTISGYVGIVSRYSFVSGPEGNYFLSENGVARTSHSQYLKEAFATELVSNQLDNFTKKSMSDLSRAVGYYHNKERKYMLSIGDTLYVYDVLTNAWSTWNMPFQAAITFSKSTTSQFVPGDTMYFIPQGTSILARYGTDSLDMGGATTPTVIQMDWQSGPIFTDRSIKTINKVGLWTNGSDATDSIQMAISDLDLSVLETLTVDSLDNSFNGYGVASRQSQSFFLRLFNSSSDSLITTSIDGIDVIFTPSAWEYKYK